jgi:hypothetical protein
VQLRRLRPYTVNIVDANKDHGPSAVHVTPIDTTDQSDEPTIRPQYDRASLRRGSVQAAVSSTLESLHHKEHEDHTEVLARQEREMHEKSWNWLETLLKVNRNTNTCLIILTLKPRRLHEVLHGHKQVLVD